MDLLNIIREKSVKFPEGFKTSGIDAVILHIETAEKYWNRAKLEDDENLFTDVIYRTNQAFEGILKEAYSILAGKNASKATPYQIEKYFESNSAFKERVLSAFTNYRTEWRNTSTHDYKLFFTEQESLLAIASVSTFCTILLDQIITKANEIHERERAEKFSKEVIGKIKDYKNLNFNEKIKNLLLKSYEYLSFSDENKVKEYEFIGTLSGYIEAVDPTLKVESEVLLDKTTRERADLIISSQQNEKVLVDVKRSSFARRYENESSSQIVKYLHLSGIKNGYLLEFDEKAKKGTSLTQRSLFDDGPTITYIKPEN